MCYKFQVSRGFRFQVLFLTSNIFQTSNLKLILTFLLLFSYSLLHPLPLAYLLPTFYYLLLFSPSLCRPLAPSLFRLFHSSIPYPTLPSRLICNSFCASTANSIGSLLRTSFAYPLTIKPIASSAEIPRWLQ